MAYQPKNETRRIDWDPVTHYQDIEIAERYDRERFSRFTGRVFNGLEKYYIRQAFRDIPPGATVLDLPCGTGRLAEILLNRGHRVAGVDISPVMLEVARRKLARFGDRFTASVLDIFDLPPETEPVYDAALCARVLMHFPLEEQIRFLKGVARLTKGPVILTQSLSTGYQRFRRRLKKWIGNPPSAAYPITDAELAQLLDGAGLVEVQRLRPARLLSEAVIVVAKHK